VRRKARGLGNRATDSKEGLIDFGESVRGNLDMDVSVESNDMLSSVEQKQWRLEGSAYCISVKQSGSGRDEYSARSRSFVCCRRLQLGGAGTVISVVQFAMYQPLYLTKDDN
jgi:hypothetical protein